MPPDPREPRDGCAAADRFPCQMPDACRARVRNTPVGLALRAGREQDNSTLRIELWAGGDPELANPGGSGNIADTGATLIDSVFASPTVNVGEGEDMTVTLSTGASGFNSGMHN